MGICSNAQLQRSVLTNKAIIPKYEMASKSQAMKKEMKMATDANPIVKKAPMRDASINGYYKRPAGGFVGFQAVSNGTYYGGFYSPYMMLSP